VAYAVRAERPNRLNAAWKRPLDLVVLPGVLRGAVCDTGWPRAVRHRPIATSPRLAHAAAAPSLPPLPLGWGRPQLYGGCPTRERVGDSGSTHRTMRMPPSHVLLVLARLAVGGRSNRRSPGALYPPHLELPAMVRRSQSVHTTDCWVPLSCLALLVRCIRPLRARQCVARNGEI
jgi:hypothetical protein